MVMISGMSALVCPTMGSIGPIQSTHGQANEQEQDREGQRDFLQEVACCRTDHQRDDQKKQAVVIYFGPGGGE